MSKILLVIGPESSATRVFTQLLSSHPDVTGADNIQTHIDLLDNIWQEVENGNKEIASKKLHLLKSQKVLITRRSLPHGGRGTNAQYMVFPKLNEFIELCRDSGFEVLVLITTRNPSSNIISWSKKRASADGDINKAMSQYQESYKLIFTSIIKFNLTYYFLNLETLILEESKYLNSILELLNLSHSAIKLDINKNANSKYYSAQQEMKPKSLEKEYKLPNQALHYILLQRTKLQYWNKKFMRLTNKDSSLLLKLDCLLRQKKIRKSYFEALKGDYSTFGNLIEPMITESNCNIIDIGCGIAGIDILLSENAHQDAEFFLLDKTQLDSDIHYQFTDNASFYNSLEIAKNGLVQNGINSNNIELMDVGINKDVLHNVSDNFFNLSISLLSWGYHYPLETYLKDVYRTLKSGGILIIDIRNKKENLILLEDLFFNVVIVSDFKKGLRLACYKK